MASLTGNKIKDTYTSLLKVGDNGTIDSSAQALTDLSLIHISEPTRR